MDKKTASLVDIIFARHTNALAAAADGECVPLGTVRFSLHLALAELADWITPPEMPAALAPQQTPDRAPRLMTAEEADAADEDAEGENASPASKRKFGGRPKGSKNLKTQRQNELGESLAAAVANGAEVVPDGVIETTLTGKLKREETVTRRVNGVPQQFTRQYIELR